MLHYLFQRQGVRPCEALRKRGGDCDPNLPLCQGCVDFMRASMRVQIDLEEEANRKAGQGN